MPDDQFYAEIAKICAWLKANKMEAVTRHVRRHFPVVIISRRKPKKSRLDGSAR